MNGKRPTVLTVFGVLNIIFGSLGLLCNLCMGGFIALFAVILNQPAQDREVAKLQEMMRPLVDAPGFAAFITASMVVGIILAAVLLFSGIGLLKVQPWARTASIFWAVTSIIIQIGSLAYTIAVVNPAMENWLRQVAAQAKQGIPPPQNPAASAAQSVVGAVIGMTYAVVLLIFMFTPTVVNAFKRRGGIDPYDRDQEIDDYERRRFDEPS